jgi:hypothetical protein
MVQYLYGDSTPSPLTTDYIALLHNIFDFSVEVLLHENRVSTTMQKVASLSDSTDAEVFRAEQIVADIFQALESYRDGDGDSIAGHCAVRILRGVQDLVRSEAGAARAVVAMEKARAMQSALIARGACAKAFETLVLRQDLPDSVVTAKVWLQGQSRYGVRLFWATPYGLKWTIEVEVPESSGFARLVRIDSVAKRVAIDAPASTGWFRKEVKVCRQRFDRLYVTELTVDPTSTIMRLRKSPRLSSAGYDVSLSASTARVEVLRVLEGGAAPDFPHEVSDEDAVELRSLREAFVGLIGELSEAKQVLVTASLDETPLDQLETPHLLVQRLVDSVAPTVEQISRQSPVPGELALKRVLSETQREEVFVSRAELRKRLEPLPAVLRQVFDPLKLWETTEATTLPEPVVSPPKPAPENKAHGALQALGLLSVGPLRSEEWEADPPASVSSTGKWPALHAASLPIAELRGSESTG